MRQVIKNIIETWNTQGMVPASWVAWSWKKNPIVLWEDTILTHFFLNLSMIFLCSLFQGEQIVEGVTKLHFVGFNRIDDS